MTVIKEDLNQKHESKKKEKKLVFGFCPQCGSEVLRKAGFTKGSPKKQRYLCVNGHRVVSLRTDSVVMRRSLPQVKRYLITSAQNATPIHERFWNALLQAKKYYDAELVVIPGRYKNPTSIWTQKNQENEWWDKNVLPYLFDGRINLNDRIVILGDLKIQWAAANPLSGLNTITGDKSGIVGHGNRALRSIAAPQYKHPKIMFTTGSCTTENYTDTKRGKIAEFNHSIGGLIVEIDGDTFYARQLSATKDGSFIDLDVEFSAEGVRPAERALALSQGDSHVRFVDPNVIKATFDNEDSLVRLIRPKYIVWHDLLDQHSRNHHHRLNNDWITELAKQKAGIESLREEIEEAVKFVNEKTPRDSHSVIVSSNHDRAVSRWLLETDFRKDPINAEFYLELALMIAKTAHRTSGGVAYDDAFILYARNKKLAGENVRFLKEGESFLLHGVQYGLHGDKGPNGARGTTKNLSAIGVKATKGHSHTAEIIDGCYSSGTSTPRLEYEGGGPSSHTNSHVVQYANGKRTIIFIINGNYCLPRPKQELPNSETQDN